jgi:hypothetical protein
MNVRPQVLVLEGVRGSRSGIYAHGQKPRFCRANTADEFYRHT